MFAKENLSYKAIDLPHRQNLNAEEMLISSQNFYEFMSKRCSVREFDKTPVGREVIENIIKAAGSAPSGANHQPWHFVAISNADIKHKIRIEAEKEEEHFYKGGGASDEWIKALEPIGTGVEKSHLDDAPWLIIVFAQRWGYFDDGTKYKNYYVPESVGISCGMLLSAIHHAGLVALTHTPNPMKFLTELLDRPSHEKPVMIIPVGYPAQDAKVPQVARLKKSLDEIASFKE